MSLKKSYRIKIPLKLKQYNYFAVQKTHYFCKRRKRNYVPFILHVANNTNDQ